MTQTYCFIKFEDNRGKASVLNDLVMASSEDYLVFSDANTEFETDAIQKLMRHFDGEAPVDAVCGELDLYAEATGENLDSAYWKYERVLKFNESRISGLLGANGAIYAIRKNCYKPINAENSKNASKNINEGWGLIGHTEWLLAAAFAKFTRK